MWGFPKFGVNTRHYNPSSGTLKKYTLLGSPLLPESLDALSPELDAKEGEQEEVLGLQVSGFRDTLRLQRTRPLG